MHPLTEVISTWLSKLALVQRNSPRLENLDADTIAAWSEILGDITAEEAHRAFRYHGGSSPFFPAPSEIRTIVLETRPPATTLEPAEESTPLTPEEQEANRKFWQDLVAEKPEIAKRLVAIRGKRDRGPGGPLKSMEEVCDHGG